MAPDWLQPRNRHIVAVIALLASPVGGFVASPQPFPTQQQQQQGPQGSIRPQQKGQQRQQHQQQQQQQQCGATPRALTTATAVASTRSSLYGQPVSPDGDRSRSDSSAGSQRLGSSSQLRRGWAMNIGGGSTAQEQRRKSFLYGFGWRWDGPSYLSLHSPKSSKLPPETGEPEGEGGATAWHTSAGQEGHSGPRNDTSSGAAPRNSTDGLGVRVGWRRDVRVDGASRTSSPSAAAAAAAAAAVAAAGKVKGMGGRGPGDGGGGHMNNTTGNVTTATATATAAAAHTNDTMTDLTQGGKVRQARTKTLNIPHVVLQQTYCTSTSIVRQQ
ncbi:unnamed protein product [Laminaria digitata]